MDAPLARIRVAAAGARTLADVERLLDELHAYADGHPAHAEASAGVAEQPFVALQALALIVALRPRGR